MPEDVMPPDEPPTAKRELDHYRLVVTQLQGKIRDLEEELKAAASMREVPVAVVTQPELRNTLSRLISRVAMIVQAEKVMILLYQGDTGELAVLPPTLGVTEAQAAELRMSADEGISGLVFRSGASAIYNDALNDPRTLDAEVSLLRIRNGVCVPLNIKQRDEEERVVDERVIGVMHVFNKRHDMDFIPDDQRLLEMLADQAAAIISNAQLYIELTREKEQLEHTFESIHSGVVVTSIDGRIRLINKAACDLLRLPNQEYQGMSYRDVIQHPQVVSFLAEAISARQETVGEIGDEDSPTVYKAEATLMGGENGDVANIVAIFTDITEIRQVERMKTAFVSTVSHELRTPLTSIKGFTATLLDDPDGSIYDSETRYEFYTIIDQECDRLTRLISDLLNVSRIESGRALDMQISEVSLQTLCGRVLTAQQQYTDRHKLLNEIPEDFPVIEADADKIYQIVDNLIGNAVKYSPNGGNIVVRAEDEGDTVRLIVRDPGLGIPEQHRDRIFERFHMVDDDVNHKKVKGTGIGLYLVQHLARAHKGEVFLSWTEVGQGSEFSVRLPKISQVDE